MKKIRMLSPSHAGARSRLCIWRAAGLGVVLSLGAVLAPAFAARPDVAAGNVQRGHELFNTWCVGCHRATVVDNDNPHSLVNRVVAGTYTLQQRYHGAEPAALEQRTDLTPDYIRTIVRQGLRVMPRTRKTELTDAQLDDVVAYLTRNNPEHH